MINSDDKKLRNFYVARNVSAESISKLDYWQAKSLAGKLRN